MILKGQKRKLPQDDEEVSDRTGPLWESQRQFVFSVSLNKYQRSQELPEPSLRRSVLIANTLRQISLETCGAPPPDREASQPSCSSPFTPQEAVPVDDVCTGPAFLNYFPHNAGSRSLTSCHASESKAPSEEDDEDWGSMSTDSDLSLSAAISSILTALDSTIDGSSQAAQRTPLRALENLSGPSEGSVVLTKQEIRDYGVNWDQQAGGKVREGSTEATRSSHMDDVIMEDLFQDIDTSQLERDMGVLGLRRNGGGFSAADDLIRCLPPLSQSAASSHPFSFSLNPNLKYLPSFSSFSPLSSSSPLNSAGSASFSGQNQVREGLELEQLMEILVES
ncbi:SERTA domain-containing protein 3 [Kryptolebias marmoratus]|uniref:SERTA domain-containing protein 2-like n=1 Tax=Kryptolebias marmoratus TaxID=37003 RepID=A0A3Q3BQ37_KRYMA|nr:SERTA domain-containing protein 3 [Kryptolebias marmoratus]XP_017291758.1 SERTA domain-containing protein 3 [Kryptolebias marmoratus]